MQGETQQVLHGIEEAMFDAFEHGEEIALSTAIDVYRYRLGVTRITDYLDRESWAMILSDLERHVAFFLPFIDDERRPRAARRVILQMIAKLVVETRQWTPAESAQRRRSGLAVMRAAAREASVDHRDLVALFEGYNRAHDGEDPSLDLSDYF